MFNLLKMVFNIKDVVVNRISLISRGKKPAVPKAETSFSIFKMANKSIITKENKVKLDKLSDGYGEIKKAKKKTLYVNRKVKNGKDLLKFAKDQGLDDLIKTDELHLTVAFSKTKVDHESFDPDVEEIELTLKDAKIEKLGDAIVLTFSSDTLEKGWKKYIDGGASWDFDGYKPHISLSYTNDQDITKIDKFSGNITLLGETLEEISLEYLKKIEEILKKYKKDIEKKV